MTDRFSIIPLSQLTEITLSQLDNHKEVFGIPEDLFFKPNAEDPFRSYRYGQLLETPFGVAAGPHTQMAQNIVVAWLTGARYIELKTIQTLDELDVSKPCIDMQDEGYNCEWSQELKIHESFNQYLDAWILIHVLKNKLNHGDKDEPGFIFNMSVGYDYEGIVKDNVQWFFNKMADASKELEEKVESLKAIYPNIVNLNISPRISDNITLSTMHGCPPDEIEKIGRYLIGEKKLNTTIKLNPTLLGKGELHDIIKNAGFDTHVPDIAFEHDLKYPEAISIIKNLQDTAKEHNVGFGIKLTNTLESKNHKDVFPENEKMMYMSGRALHPISVGLAKKLQNEFEGRLDISFSGGVDYKNISEVTACGLFPATVCSDILKPGGYGLFHQYIESLQSSFEKTGAKNMESFILRSSEEKTVAKAIIANLDKYYHSVLQNPDYKKTDIQEPSIKTRRKLSAFDCIQAPCVNTCPTNQDIPDYMYYTAKGDFQKAFEVIMDKNPFPNTTGMICDHLCQTKCTRINYDKPVLIREIKRFIAENQDKGEKPTTTENERKIRVSIIGAGPSGLSCAYFLRKAGIHVEIYETKEKSGGMVSGAIPSFRLTDEAYEIDLMRILEMGAEIHYGSTIDETYFELIKNESDFTYIATGAIRSRKMNITGSEAAQVLDPLEFLFDVKNGGKAEIGKKVAIIGGGNTAMDAARTAYRLVGKDGEVTIVYRRTMKQMPADMGEIKAVLEEGMNIMELVSPHEVILEDERVTGLKCVRMKLGDEDKGGRPRPVEIEGSEFFMEFDTIIPAVGQDLDIDFVDTKLLAVKEGSYETKIQGVFIGGDAMRGASTAINAIGDGRKAAEEIIQKAHIQFENNLPESRTEQNNLWHKLKRSTKITPVKIEETEINNRKNFDLVTSPLSQEQAMAEASRCLLCDETCNICTTLCPNLALYGFDIEPIQYTLQKVLVKNGNYQLEDSNTFEVKQKHQILHIADWCNECGNCTTFCPTSGSPYKEKPHLYLNKQAFENDIEGYYFEGGNKSPKLILKKDGHISSLSLNNGNYIFKTDNINVILEKESFNIKDVNCPENGNFETSLKTAAEMSVVLKGAMAFLGIESK
ncbi:MAG: putative selenate reductase subunit YgfK [Chlorobi bacterium]|nr:putative selenate reductase subunit YgfK [Chlorobiota bacterium]